MTFDKKARLRQIRQDIDDLQVKGKHQSSSHVPAGMTYAEVFSAAINATMRHKRAMVGNLSRKSDDDSPAEMTFEEIEAYPDEGVIDDCVRPSAISLTPQPGLARNTSSRNRAPPSRESGFGAGREGADGWNHMSRGTLSVSLGRLARQSSTNLSGKDSHRTDGIAGGFAKPTLPPAMVNSSNEAIEQQQQLQQGGLHKEGEKNVGEGPHLSPISTTGGGPASPLHAQHNRLLLSQDGPRDSPGAGWGRQGGLGAMAWTGECMSPGSRRRADLALLELWRLDIADKEHGIFSRPYTAPSTVRGGKRHSSRSNSPLRGPDASSSPTLRTSPPRGSPGLRPTTSPVPATQSLPHGSQPQPPGSADTANPPGKNPLPHQAIQQGPQRWADGVCCGGGGGGGGNCLPTDASRAPSAAEAAAAPGPWASRPPVFGADAGDAAGTGASGLRAGSSTSADPRTWPFAPSHAAQGQGVGQGVDVILEEAENEEEEEGGDFGEGPGHEYEDPAQERQKPGFYHIMRRAPHHIITATTPYLMGLSLEVLASKEEVPCLADVVARQIWHPPRQALNPAEHQQLREQVETAVAARKQRLSRVRPPHNPAAAAAADADAGPSDAWHQQNIQQAGQVPITTSSMLEDGDNAAGGQAHSEEPPISGGHDKGTGSPGMPASPSSGYRKATDKLPKAQGPGEKGKGGRGKAKGLIIRKSNPGLESQLGWDTVIRGPQRASRTNAVDGDGDELQEEDEEAKKREEEAIHKGGMKLLTPPPAPKRAPVGSWVSQGSAPHQKKGPPAKASTWEKAQFYAQQQQQQMQEREQAARIQEQQVVDKPIYTPGLLTQQQQAQRQRQLAQQHYTLRQQEQEREGMKMIQQEKQQQEQLKQAQTSEAGHEQQQQQQRQGVHAMKLQRVMSSRSHQDREERLQAARNRKQARDDKLRQAIVLQNSKTPPNLPLLKNQLQTPPPSPPLSQIGFLDSLRPPRQAQLPPRNSKEPPSN